MNKKEWAEKLNGREYNEELTEQECKELKQQQLVVVFGASDDLMEFRGAINDEFDCFEGGTVALNNEGLLRSKCSDPKCPYFLILVGRAVRKQRTVEAIWGKDGYSWVYNTKIPHETFDILVDGEKYCKGIIFDFKDTGGLTQ
jgi:hypothetical protein